MNHDTTALVLLLPELCLFLDGHEVARTLICVCKTWGLRLAKEKGSQNLWKIFLQRRVSSQSGQSLESSLPLANLKGQTWFEKYAEYFTYDVLSFQPYDLCDATLFPQGAAVAVCANGEPVTINRKILLLDVREFEFSPRSWLRMRSGEIDFKDRIRGLPAWRAQWQEQKRKGSERKGRMTEEERMAGFILYDEEKHRQTCRLCLLRPRFSVHPRPLGSPSASGSGSCKKAGSAVESERKFEFEFLTVLMTTQFVRWTLPDTSCFFFSFPSFFEAWAGYSFSNLYDPLDSTIRDTKELCERWRQHKTDLLLDRMRELFAEVGLNFRRKWIESSPRFEKLRHLFIAREKLLWEWEGEEQERDKMRRAGRRKKRNKKDGKTSKNRNKLCNANPSFICSLAGAHPWRFENYDFERFIEEKRRCHSFWTIVGLKRYYSERETDF